MDNENIGARYMLSAIPNTADGRAFIKQLRGYLNRDRWSVRLRGNAPAKDGKVYPYGVPTGQASYLRLYADDSALSKIQATDHALRQTVARLATVRAELDRVQALHTETTTEYFRVEVETEGRTEHWQYAYATLAAAETAIADSAGNMDSYAVPDLSGHEGNGSYCLVYTTDDDGLGRGNITRYRIYRLQIVIQ
jgi:hypothetical protein